MWREVLNFTLKNGSTLVATQANVWQGSLTVEQAVSSEGAFEIGSTHIGQMTVTLADIDASRISNAVFSLNSEGHLILDGERVSYQTVYANTDFTDATVVVYMAQNDDTLQQMGVYNVVSAVRDEGTISITAYDNVTKLSVPYVTALSFPSTYGAMANEICGRTMTFDGSATAVATKPEGEDLTKREVLGYIAQACGYNVICDNTGRIQFVRYNLSGFSTEGQYHAISSLYDFHHSQYPVVITGAKVIVATTVDTTDPDTGEVTSSEVTNTYTSGTDDYQIVIENNPLITTANGQAVADLIFATYGGVSFYTGTVSHISDLSIKASDIMKVTDRLGNTYPMLVSSTRVSTGAAQSTGSYAEEPASKLSVQPTELGRVQNSVRQALLDAKNGQNKANYASRIASNTNQYFWHTETGSDTGAHITEIPQEDFLADPTNGGGNLLARSNGIAVRDGLTELATFSANRAQVGVDTSNHLTMSNAGLVGISETGIEMFKIWSGDYSGTTKITESSGAIANTNEDKSVLQTISYAPNADPVDLTNITITVTVVASVAGATKNHTFTFTRLYDESSTNLFVNIETWSSQLPGIYVEVRHSYSENTKDCRIYVSTSTAGATIDNAQITATLTVADPTVPSYTFGLRSGSRSEEGPYSFVAGTQNIASGEASAAFGVENEVSGMGASAYGASNFVSGNYGFATGQSNSASGQNATALGFNLLASSSSQTVIGRYNVADTNDEYAFIIGNGDVSDRHNLLTMGWNGETRLYGRYSYFFSDDNAEHQVRFTNQAHIDGLTYADDGVYPHSCYFYGCSGASAIGLGAWDLRNAHHIWRYNDHDQYLELYNNIRVNNRRVDFPQLLGSTASGSFTLPVTKGCYLIVTGHNSTAGANSIWIARMGSNNMFKLAGGSNITITASGNNTITVTSSGGSVNVSYIFLGYNN